MKILFCSHNPLSKERGAPKVIIELAEAMNKNGHDCELLYIKDICPDQTINYDNLSHKEKIRLFSEALKNHLVKNAHKYDVVDYDHIYLPYPRDLFPRQTLFVARSVLLSHHFTKIKIPIHNTLRGIAGYILKGFSRKMLKTWEANRGTTTFRQADLINVSNPRDVDELVDRGLNKNKICLNPFAISDSRRPDFDNVSSEIPESPLVCFVGTFDLRKGAREFPDILTHISAVSPEVKFLLLGTSAMFHTEQEVLNYFPKGLQDKLEIIPTYNSPELPNLLSRGTVGIFPSHIEGFGFGVLEMLASSIPVVAYDAPGPPMMLNKNFLVPRGDSKAMAIKVIKLLNDQENLLRERKKAKISSQKFSWRLVAESTEADYQNSLNSLRKNL